ncbi:hypothetical protein Taro_033892 [Colocasia esculenta]|uniref:Uncharacterized protein n=1 Tax=Colocasia esculenta TaxID=4460 RepID=A0A843W8B7_COLES|nr:hypothetical protein [Colocasia esculenta]
MGLVEVLQEKLPRFRFHALALGALAALALSLARLGPSFLSVVSFFWPLLLSTAFFLAAILVLRIISPTSADPPSNQAGEEFMDYVASRNPLEDHRPGDDEGSSDEDGEEAATSAAAGEQGAEAAEGTKKSQ